MSDTAAPEVTTEWCDEANGAYIVVCSTHGVVDHAPTEPEAEAKASAHKQGDTSAATPERDPYACAVCNCHHHTTERHGMDLIDTVYDEEGWGDAFTFAD